MESGTSSRREMKPDPMPEADGRDAHPYLARMIFAGGLGFAVGGLRRRHQEQSIQHSVIGLFQVGLTVLGRPGES
jgi:hypothetical protein